MRGQIYSLAVSMALAFCLWLNLAGLDTSLVDLNVGLDPHSLPDHLQIKGETPKEVTLRVRANAARVRFLADRKLILPLDLSRAQEGHNAFPVLLEPLQLPRGVAVSDINPEMIEFEALGLTQKQVPVKPNLVGQPAPAFRLEGLTLEPSAVTVQGPPEILAQVEDVETAVLSVDGLARDAVFTVNLIPPEGALAIVGSKEVLVTVNISEIRTQAVFSDIPVEIEVRKQGGVSAGPPGGDAASFIAQPARVSVEISWPSSRGRPVDAREVRAIVSVDGEQLRAEGRIDVPVVALPPGGASVTAINPAAVGVSHVPQK